MPTKPTPKVFFDANVLIQGGKPPGGPILSRIADLVEADLIEVLTTDLTIAEVSKKHAENDYEVIKEIGRPHFRKIAEEATGVTLPPLTKAHLKTKFSKTYHKAVSAMFKRFAAKALAIDDVKPSVVFSAYAKSKGFFTGDGKKDQFPDAFIFECLKKEASKKSPVIIVSDDNDFKTPVEAEAHISLVKSIPELFQILGLQVEAPKLDEFFANHKEELIKAVDSELDDWGLNAIDVEDADIEETNVTDVELQELKSFRSVEKGGSILVVGRMTVTAMATYTHPDWDNAAYDSEDKVLISFDDVSGETEVILEVEFSMPVAVDDNGSPSEIDEVRFRNANFQWVELHPYDPDG